MHDLPLANVYIATTVLMSVFLEIFMNVNSHSVFILQHLTTAATNYETRNNIIFQIIVISLVKGLSSNEGRRDRKVALYILSNHSSLVSTSSADCVKQNE